MYWIYVLINYSAGRRYVGQTENLTRRLSEHNSKEDSHGRYTAKFPGEWNLVYSKSYPTRSEAMKMEKWLKTGIGRKWLDDTIGRAGPPKAD
jgi:putative endonuclease